MRLHRLRWTLLIISLSVGQLMQLQADHGDELGTAVRAVTQAIERTRANVNWMALHYNEVLEWLPQH